MCLSVPDTKEGATLGHILSGVAIRLAEPPPPTRPVTKSGPEKKLCASVCTH